MTVLTRGYGLKVIIGLLSTLLLSHNSFAENTRCDSAEGIGHDYAVVMGEQGEIVPLLYRHVGLMQDVPYKILYAIGLQESRLPGGNRPWPWTLNIGKKGHYFDCREEALHAIAQAQAEGIQSIDVGLGQVNLRWNGHLFSTPEDALDPTSNLIAATRVLQREFKHCHSLSGNPDWWCAVGRYHSGGSSEKQRARARRYSDKVFALWETLK